MNNRNSVDKVSHELVCKYTAQPLKFAYYEHFVATPPMRTNRRASLANRVLILLIIVASLILLFYRSGPSFTQDDRACIQDEWIGNTSSQPTEDFGTHYRLSFADSEKNYSWLYLPPASESESHEVLLMSISGCDNFARRNTLRRTWMNADKNRIVAEKRVKTLFIVGVRKENPRLNQVVLEEAKLFGDMVVADFEDEYVGLTVKSLSALLYAVSKSPSTKLIGKIDEDVMLLPDQFYNLLEQNVINLNSSTIYGDTFEGGVPVKHRPGKWEVPMNIFKCSVYPPYVSGTAYFVTEKAAKRVLSATRHRKAITVEDIFITGLLAGDVGVPKTNIPMIFSQHESTTDEEKYELLTWHTVKNNEQFEAAFEEMRLTRCTPCRRNDTVSIA